MFDKFKKTVLEDFDPPKRRHLLADFVTQIYNEEAYFIVVTLTTVGYGEKTGTKDDLFILTAITLFGLLSFSFLNGNIMQVMTGQIVRQIVSPQNHYLQKIERFNNYLVIHNNLNGI